MVYQVIAFIILLAFYGCYFTKMIMQKRKGIKTDQIGKQKKGFVKFIEMTLKVATLSVPMVEVVSIFLKTTQFPTWIRIVGIIFGVLGTGVFISAVVTMRDSWRAGVSETDKTELVTSGIYQISRNPAFLGFDLVYIGMVLMFFNWVLFVFSVFAVLLFHFQITNVEEDFLIIVFGDEYIKYRKKVFRYLGRKIR